MARFKFEVKDHGVEHVQYWKGDGVMNTEWEDVVTGCGDSAREAGEQAAQQMFAILHDPASIDVNTLLDFNDAIEKLTAEVDARPEDAASEVTHFVTIKWRWESEAQA